MAEQSNNIEEFFKRFSETYPAKIEFNEAHWKRMESMLDEELPFTPSAGGEQKPFPLAPVLTILVLILIFLGVMISSFPGEEAPLPAESSQPVEANESPRENAKVTEEGSAVPPVSGGTLNDGAAQVPPVKSERALAGDEQNPEEAGAYLVTNEEALEAEPSGGAFGADRDRSDAPIATVGLAVDDDLSKRVTSSREYGEGPILQGLLPPTPGQVAPGDHSVSPVVVEDFPVKEHVAFPRISVAVGVSPDLSSNQIGTYNRTGSAFGGIFEYRFSRRWSVEVGVLSAKKKYAVDGEDYSPKEGFWENTTQGQVPNTIDADCWVIDLPVNVRYRVLQNESSTLSASVGLSSYLMMSEDYYYTLGYGSDGWGSGHENDHFFGAANIQLHYEKRIGELHAFEVAPFVKLPLTGYGHGDIKFHSTGILLSFKRYLLWK